MKKTTLYKRISPIMEQLEDRVLFDASPDAVFLLPDNADTQPELARTFDVQSIDENQQQQPVQLILIDEGIENAQDLIADITASSDSNFEIRLLSAEQDGVSQISEILNQSRSNYEAIHILSHGSEGEVALGNNTLSSDNISQYADELAGWADALTEDADLLFYGCDLAGNQEGQQFIETISAMTGADVAASDDLTGAADQGGDWDLEANVGIVEAAALSAENWSGTLTTQSTITGAELSGGLTGNTTSVTKDGNTVTFSETAGTDGLTDDGALGVGFAGNSDAIETHDLEVNFAIPVAIAELEFSSLNNDDQDAARGGTGLADGIEQLFDFTVLDASGADITSSVRIQFDDHSTQGGLSFQESSDLGPTTRTNALVPDGPSATITGDSTVDLGSFGESTNGVLRFVSGTAAEISTITFSHENIADADAGDDLPFGAVLQSVGFTPEVLFDVIDIEVDEDGITALGGTGSPELFGLTLDTALREGGQFANIVGTETGFGDLRTAQTFTIPAGVDPSNVRITVLGSDPGNSVSNNDGGNNRDQDHLQVFLNVDLNNGTYSGVVQDYSQLEYCLLYTSDAADE